MFYFFEIRLLVFDKIVRALDMIRSRWYHLDTLDKIRLVTLSLDKMFHI